MGHPDTSIYITCTRRKGRQKKHVAVCDTCRWQSTCDPYQAYQLEKTQKNHDVLLTIPEKAFIERSFLNDVRRELMEVNSILADYRHDLTDYHHDKCATGIIGATDSLKKDNLLEYFQNELGQLKSLFNNLPGPVV